MRVYVCVCVCVMCAYPYSFALHPTHVHVTDIAIAANAQPHQRLADQAATRDTSEWDLASNHVHACMDLQIDDNL